MRHLYWNQSSKNIRILFDTFGMQVPISLRVTKRARKCAPGVMGICKVVTQYPDFDRVAKATVNIAAHLN